ncbi:hypothetical protein [Exiguobacterium aurantiacum]|nr:hypothetical protein [Exiguobacterium aurantiacum]
MYSIQQLAKLAGTTVILSMRNGTYDSVLAVARRNPTLLHQK